MTKRMNRQRSKAVQQERQAIDALLKKTGYTGTKGQQHHERIPSYKTNQEGVAPTSGNIAGIAPKHSREDYRWKSGVQQETSSTEAAIREKASRVGIPYNKGAYQLITSPEDVKDLGKK